MVKLSLIVLAGLVASASAMAWWDPEPMPPFDEYHHSGGCECTALHAAVKSQNGPGVDLLLKEGGQPVDSRDCNSRTPLHWAAIRGSLKMVQTLVQHNATIDALCELGHTPAWHAFYRGHRHVATYLHSLRG
ncbi:Ankyrin repeat domain-containing protein [Plasmodiophora brassicae]